MAANVAALESVLQKRVLWTDGFNIRSPIGQTFGIELKESVVLQVALISLALVTGDCPACAEITPNGLIGGRAVANHLPYGKVNRIRPIYERGVVMPWIYVLPRAIVGCAGPYCASCNCVPGVAGFDYRTNFNYPWSQKPCAMVAPLMAPDGSIPEVMPNSRPAEELPTPEAVQASSKRRPKSTLVQVRQSNVRIVDGSERALPRR